MNPNFCLFTLLILLLFGHVIKSYPANGDDEEEEIPPVETQTEPAGGDTVGEAKPEIDAQGEGDLLQPVEATKEPLQCNVAGLIKSMVEVLEKWVLHMWNYREKIVAVDNDICEIQEKMHFTANYPSCTKLEILNVSRLITDVVLHRKNAGSFLKSYFFAEFPCSKEGREIVNKYRLCLSHNNLNTKALWLSHLIEHEFMHHLGIGHLNLTAPHHDASDNVRDASDSVHDAVVTPQDSTTNEAVDTWYCNKLKSRAQELFDASKEMCTEMPGYLMCRSISDAFKNLYPTELANCQIPCSVSPQPKSGGLNGESGNGVPELSTLKGMGSSTVTWWTLYTVNLISLIIFKSL